MENFYEHFIKKAFRGKFLTPMAKRGLSTLLLVFGLFFGVQGVLAHGVQIGYCVLGNGNLRVYVEHWHGSSTSGPLSVTTTYSDGSSTTQIINATGYAWNTTVDNLPGCGADINIIEQCPDLANTYNDWLYWDFPPGACDGSEIITVNAGTNATTAQACNDLYPQTINPTELTCPDVLVQSCVGTTVDYAVGVTDFCDPNVMLDYSIPSGSYFNTGTTEVMVTATNSFGYMTNCKFDVFVGELDADADGDGHTSPDACTGTQDDCDDNNPNVYPGAPEICDGVDNNCDGEMETATVYDIPVSDFYNLYYMCDYYSGLSWKTYYDFGFYWMSTGNNIPSNVSVEFVLTYDYHPYYEYYYSYYYTPDRTASLNGVYQTSFPSVENYECEESMYYQKNHVQLNLDPADYNPGGYNYFDFGNVFTDITIYSDPGVFPTGIFARVCVEYCNTADEAPIVDEGTCPGDITLCGAQTVTWTPPTATDNCDIPTVSSNYNPGDYFDVGVHNVIYTFTDEAGLTTTCEFKVTINPLPDLLINQTDLPVWCQGVQVLNVKIFNIADLAQPLTYQWSTGETSPDIIVTANGPYSVVVTDANGCSSSAMTFVDEDLTQLLSAHTIVVENEMDMDNSVVLTGGVGVLDAEEVTVQNNSDITTFLVSAQAAIDGSSNVSDFDATDSPLSLPLFMSNSFNDTNDQVINGTVTLSGSNYGHVFVKGGSTLNIANDEMYMKSLTVSQGGTVNFNQPGSLMIRQKLRIGELCNINVEGPRVVVYAQDNVSVGQGSTVAVNIYAPEGMDVNDSGSSLTTYMYGMFIAEELNSGDNVVWGWNLTCGGVDSGGNGECVTVGAASGSLPAITKGVNGFCFMSATPVSTCDCPSGYVVTGYEGLEGNNYGPDVVNQFSLRCRELNSDGTLGNTVMVTCSNGSYTSGSPDGPFDADPNHVLVGAEIGMGCAMDRLGGYAKPLSAVIAGSSNSSSALMPYLGGSTGGFAHPPQYVPDGHVIVGMNTYEALNSSLPQFFGITAGVAWRYAPISNCGEPLSEAIGMIETTIAQDRVIDDLIVFPNPSSGEFEVGVGDYIDSSMEVVITNLMGQQVWFQKVDQLQRATLTIDLTADRYPSGLYNMTVLVNDTVITKQIVLTK